MRQLTILVLLLGFLFSVTSVATAQSDERCRREKLKAFKKDAKCISTTNIKGFKKDLPVQDIETQVEACKVKLTERFERAEARALDVGLQCPAFGDADAVHEGLLTACCPLCGCSE